MSNTITTSFPIKDINTFKAKALLWANQFDCCCYLDSNSYNANRFHRFEALIAAAPRTQLLHLPNTDTFARLRQYHEINQSWLFGYFSYDLKNEVEHLYSNRFDGLGFPEFHCFAPSYLLQVQKEEVLITAENPPSIWKAIQQTPLHFHYLNAPPQLKARMPKAQYLKAVDQVREHIIQGDLYEMNLCQEFYARDVVADPASLFYQLNQIAKAPFSAYYKLDHRYLLCSSPERFLCKRGADLFAQPIKGTIKRGRSPKQDQQLRQLLIESEKDRAEHIMIVDLIRNDLARSCEAGSVKVEELFGAYAFEQVHHLISTIKGTLRPEVHWTEAIRAAFPMGSMTGAPKVMSMELIEHYERSKRGLYSGSVGYISPEGDFDFNVVIRSLQYNALEEYLSFQVGGAIVYDSVAEREYEECLLKAKGILKALSLSVQETCIVG